jgi:hypothetical protein
MQACIEAKRAAPTPVDGAAFPDPAPAAPSGRRRTGKIARLPHAVREALNERLRDGLPCAEILSWLNSLPVVREVLRRHFDGSPMTQENISRWCHGGYAGWLENQQTKEAMAIMLAACRGIDQAQRDELTSQLALVVTARMVVELRKFDEMPEGPLKSAAWRQLVWSLVLLRRGEFYAGKLQLERDKLFPKKEAERPLCAQEQQERVWQALGLGGPHWNNDTQQWEGEGAAEMTEKEEVERLVWEELRRRKAALAAPAPHDILVKNHSPHPDPLPQAGEGNADSEDAPPALSRQMGEGVELHGPGHLNNLTPPARQEPRPTEGGPAEASHEPTAAVAKGYGAPRESCPTDGEKHPP